MSDMVLQTRKVNIDFTSARIDWNPAGPEFSHVFNAFSSLAPSLEPFLIRTMRAAQPLLPPDAGALRSDIDLFNSQEGRHYRMHAQFNKVLYAAGYELSDAEAKLKADYERFFTKKGLKFCVAYSEGFETMGFAFAGFFFERPTEVMEQWDEPTTFLWLWHVAEEWEHRAVVNHVYKKVYGDYWYRIYGLAYACVHIFGYVLKNSNRMIKQDLAAGRIKGGRLASRRRQVSTLLGLFRVALPRMVRICCRRSYDPAEHPPFERANLILSRASEKYGVA